MAGPPMEEISIAEPLANSGETVLSPSVLHELDTEVISEPVASQPGFVILRRLKGQRIAAPPPLERISLAETDVDLLKR